MNKFIIDNRTILSDLDSLYLIIEVVKIGRVSNNNKQYCYGTSITFEGGTYMIWTDLNKKSDRFVITNNKNYVDKTRGI